MLEKSVEIGLHEILQSKLTIMGMLALQGLPCRFNFLTNDHECDWSVIDCLISSYDVKKEVYRYKWRYKV